MMWRYWDWDGGFLNSGLRLGMFAVMAVWWALILVAVVLSVRWLLRQERLARAGGGGGSPESAEDPLTILKKRYARGELTREQYEEIKETLLR